MYKIEQDIKHPEMFWIIYPDNTRSADFYNKTRATEHCKVLQEEADRSALLEGSPEALGSSLVRLNRVPATTLPAQFLNAVRALFWRKKNVHTVLD